MSVLRSFDLTGQVALVTGGARGIGYEFATALAQAGADVALGDIDGAAARAAADRLGTETGRRVLAIEADVSSERSAFAMVEQAVRALGRLDACFANAGVAEPDLPIRDVADYGGDLWRRLLDVNLSGVFYTDMAAARAMRAGGGGVIVNTASIVGVAADAQWGCIGYTAAKGGVVQLTRQLAVMLAKEGVRVNAIAPGYVWTGLSEAERETSDPEVARLQQQVLDRTPMGRYARPEELRGIAVFLASAASSYCTGHTFAVDGGWLAA